MENENENQEADPKVRRAALQGVSLILVGTGVVPREGLAMDYPIGQ